MTSSNLSELDREQTVSEPCVCKGCKNVHRRQVPKCASETTHPWSESDNAEFAQSNKDRKLRCSHKAGHKGGHISYYDFIYYKQWKD